MYVFMENFIQSLTEHKASSLLKCITAQFLGIIVAFGEIMIVNCLRPYYFFQFSLSVHSCLKKLFPRIIYTRALQENHLFTNRCTISELRPTNKANASKLMICVVF